MTKQDAKKKYNAENFAEWESLNTRFYKLSPEGRGFYKSWRNLYKSMYDDIRRIMEVRLGAEMKNGEKSKLVANKLFAKLTEGGVIDPYFPLMRFGKFWLEYSAVDPATAISNTTWKHLIALKTGRLQ